MGWSTRRKWLVSVGGVLLVIVLALVGFAGYLSHTWNAGTHRVSVTVARDPDVLDGPGTNILILGTDTRGEADEDVDNVSSTRSDAIMVAHLAGNGKGVQVVSFV